MWICANMAHAYSNCMKSTCIDACCVSTSESECNDNQQENSMEVCLPGKYISKSLCDFYKTCFCIDHIGNSEYLILKMTTGSMLVRPKNTGEDLWGSKEVRGNRSVMVVAIPVIVVVVWSVSHSQKVKNQETERKVEQ